MQMGQPTYFSLPQTRVVFPATLGYNFSKPESSRRVLGSSSHKRYCKIFGVKWIVG